MILPIVSYGNDILRQKTTEAENNYELQLLIPNMIETMKNAHGVGIASVQVNNNKSLFIGHIGARDMVFINPKITKIRGERNSIEGCLSIPKGMYNRDYLGFEQSIKRHDIIDVEWFDVKFNKQKIRLRGLDSIIFQHELDHLNGILFIDYFTKEGNDKIQEKLKYIKEGKVETFYDMIFPK